MTRNLVTKAPDTINIIKKLIIINKGKSRLTPTLSESYQSLCDEDLSQSLYLLGDELPGELRKTKSRHFLEATISKRQKTGLASIKKDLLLVVSI